MAEEYDVIIVGSGPAGLTAAIYTTRASLKTLIIAGAKWGGQLQLTTEVENFPGFPEGIQGPELMLAIRKQAERFGAIFIDDDLPPTDFISMPQGGPFTLKVGQREVTGKAILIATGADAKTLGVPGEAELTGHGVSYCATCDGAFFRGKEVIVVGGGDSAMEEANFLTHFANKVTIIHRREEFKASQIMQERCKTNPKIIFLLNSEIAEIVGQEKVEKVKVRNIKTQEITELPVEGVFVAIGHNPNSKIFQGVELKDGGYVKAQQRTHTNIEGVFVSGDVEDNWYRQAITAAGYGCMAALDIERWIADKME